MDGGSGKITRLAANLLLIPRRESATVGGEQETTLPCDAEGNRSSVGTGDRGHTNSGRPATEQLLHPGQSPIGIRLGVQSCWFGPASECTDENNRHGREVITLAIQDHGNEDNKRITSRSIGTLAFADICDRRHRDGCVHLTGTLHGRACVQLEMD